MESHWHQSLPAFPPKLSVESDARSVLAYSDVDLLPDEEGLIMASKPPTRANEPPTRANEPPTGVFEPQGKAVKPSNEAGNQSNEANVPSNGGNLCDPDSQHPSLEPKADFTAVLQKNKKNVRRKLSYDQINNDILDNYSILSVNCLLSPTFRKYTQERDKELAPVQKAMLNITGPVCCLHGALSSNKDVHKEDIQTILEQSLCLLGSVNF